MNLVEIQKDKENLEDDIRGSVMSFLNKHPDVSLNIEIEKHWEEIRSGIENHRILTHVDVKVNAKIII